EFRRVLFRSFGKKVRKSDLNSNLIIGADGALSNTASWFGFPKIHEFAFCYQADFQNVFIEEKGVVDVFLSNALFPGFFGWVIPLNECEARVGLGVFRDVRKHYNKSVKHYFEKFIKHPIVSEVIGNSKKRNIVSAIIPLSIREKTAEGNVLLVGDAAGQVKATTGGGIVFGGNCARIAGMLAPAMLEKETEKYEREWRGKFERDLMLHKRMRVLYNSLSDSQIERYFAFAKKIGVESFLAKHGDMDSPTVMIKSANQTTLSTLAKAFGNVQP
ncbi:MAG: NAD(P)/FAD-dependent oxidoreductase, partial [Candidatus Micrarchaeia archaeon]